MHFFYTLDIDDIDMDDEMKNDSLVEDYSGDQQTGHTIYFGDISKKECERT